MTKLFFECPDEKATFLMKAARLYDEGVRDVEEWDRVAVIRCKDCEYCEIGRTLLFCNESKRYTTMSGYCHRGRVRG